MGALMFVVIFGDAFLTGYLLARLRRMSEVVAQLAEIQQAQQHDIDTLAGVGDAGRTDD